MIPYIAGARRIEKALVRRVRLSEDETESRVFGKRSGAVPRAPLFEVPRSGRELFGMHRNEGTAKLSPPHKINLEAKTFVWEQYFYPWLENFDSKVSPRYAAEDLIASLNR